MKISKNDDLFRTKFFAMASPCEILLETHNYDLAEHMSRIVINETYRIEQKFSRFKSDSILSQINSSAGHEVSLDDETRQLLEFSAQCFQLSDGLFDITSGQLKKIWNFQNPEFQLPEPSTIELALEKVGFNKIQLEDSNLIMPPDMELDFGGIGKEYAVDRGKILLELKYDIPFLINFGGDLIVSGPRKSDRPWNSGIESVIDSNTASAMVGLKNGALATSGNVKQRFQQNGKTYSHIINPKNGWPVFDTPKSVTVAAASCLEAGFLTTLAILHGSEAKDFLEQQEVPYWVIWPK